MIEYIYLPISEKSEKDHLEKVIENTISAFKKCDFVDDSGREIAYASKFEVLGGGISFELNDPIMDTSMKKRGVALSYKTGKFIKNVKNADAQTDRIVKLINSLY